MPSEQEALHYSDWYKLVAGLTGDSPLGHIVRIRKETDAKVIRDFGAYEKKIRTDWLTFREKRPLRGWTAQDKKNTAEYFEKLFASMFGGS